MAWRSSGIPGTGAYFVQFSSSAFLQASLIFSGLGKSGAPVVKSITLIPLAFSSLALAAAAKARELKAKGIKVIDFTTGAPDFPKPEKIKEACKKALDENWTKYAPVPG